MLPGNQSRVARQYFAVHCSGLVTNPLRGFSMLEHLGDPCQMQSLFDNDHSIYHEGK
jgi:hypothetical protein